MNTLSQRDVVLAGRAGQMTSNSSKLTAADHRNLRRSFITDEIARRARLVRVTDEEGAELVGRTRRAATDYAGVAFPYRLPETDQIRAYRLRRDIPDVERGATGALREKRKYLGAPGRGNLLYFPPEVTTEALEDESIPLVITEGEKKTLALYRLATWDLSLSRWHFVPLGLAGVWSFWGTVGKDVTATGRRCDVKGLIQDFERIKLYGRDVIILFDADVQTNENVAKARRRLANELKARGADVFYCEMPDGATIAVNGVDDLLGKWERESSTEVALEKGLELIKSARQAEKKDAQRGSQSTRLVELAEASGATFFHTSERKGFITIPVHSHVEHHPVESKHIRRWLSGQAWRVFGKAPSTQALNDALAVLCCKALFDSPEAATHVRIAELNGDIYLDLTNETWQMIKVTSEGWELVESASSPVRFRRPKGLSPLPLPVGGGTVNDVLAFVNVDPAQHGLVLVWLLACFRPNKPFPVIILNGEQGSAKSTTSSVLRHLIDPNTAPLRTMPRDERDLVIAASNSWLLAFDNLSKIPDYLSDALCRISTGSGFATRTLYENDEETLFAAKRPIMLNGITELATRPDLLDRSLIINCPNITVEQRREEDDFWSAFYAAHSRLLGAILSALSAALRILPEIRLTAHQRMADFERFGVAVERAIGLEAGSFQRAYSSNRTDAVSVGLEGSACAVLITALLETEPVWRGTATQLLATLRDLVERNAKIGVRIDDLPRQANTLSGELKRLAPHLRVRGIEFSKRKSGSREICLEVVGNVSSESSESSNPLLCRGLAVRDRDDGATHLDDGGDDEENLASTANGNRTNGLDDTDDAGDVSALLAAGVDDAGKKILARSA